MSLLLPPKQPPSHHSSAPAPAAPRLLPLPPHTPSLSPLICTGPCGPPPPLPPAGPTASWRAVAALPALMSASSATCHKKETVSNVWISHYQVVWILKN